MMDDTTTTAAALAPERPTRPARCIECGRRTAGTPTHYGSCCSRRCVRERLDEDASGRDAR